jgi:hypothetical protein
MSKRPAKPTRPCARCGKLEWTFDFRLLQQWRCSLCSAYPKPEYPCYRCGHAEWVYEAQTHNWFCEDMAHHGTRRRHARNGAG